jgi:hypothetical protein
MSPWEIVGIVIGGFVALGIIGWGLAVVFSLAWLWFIKKLFGNFLD